MSGVGGFLGREPLGAGPERYPDALALATGRACLDRVLEEVRPGRVLLPHYVCPVVLEPIGARGIPVEYFPVDAALEPVLPTPVPDDALVLVVNYFGLFDDEMPALAETLGERLVVDASQAFFQGPVEGAWAFNSARKFFGVPDGGYLFAPRPLERPDLENRAFRTEHLDARLRGDADALDLYRENERLLAGARGAMSSVTRDALAAVDYDEVARRRIENYRRLHARLADSNCLDVAPDPGSVPLCYPLLATGLVERTRLHARGIFVPCYWPDLPLAETGFERALADELLPLPIDQRYGAEEMDAIADAVLDELRDA